MQSSLIFCRGEPAFLASDKLEWWYCMRMTAASLDIHLCIYINKASKCLNKWALLWNIRNDF